MARYKAIDTNPRFLAVDLEKQLLPGSFEHAVHHLLDYEFELSRFDNRYRNHQSGASAWDSSTGKFHLPGDNSPSLTIEFTDSNTRIERLDIRLLYGGPINLFTRTCVKRVASGAQPLAVTFRSMRIGREGIS